MPDAKAMLDKMQRQRLHRIFSEANALNRDHPAVIDPLTTNRGVALQGVIIRCAFRRMFALSISSEAAAVLGQYGSISLALRDFLEQAGAGVRLATSDVLSISLRSFITRAEARHEMLPARRRFVAALDEMAGLFGGIPSLWSRARKMVNHIDSSRQNAREKFDYLRGLIAAHDCERADAVHLLRKVDSPAQRRLASVLGSEMTLNAWNVAVEIEEELASLTRNSKTDSPLYESAHHKAIAMLTQQLESNLTMFLEEN